jgi:cullin-associated NEDD8-dissociated protein 1
VDEKDKSSHDQVFDALDILSKILSRLEPSASFQNATVLSSIQASLWALSQHSRPAIRKRSTVTLGHLVPLLEKEEFNKLVKKILTGIEDARKSKDVDRLQTLVNATSTIIKSDASRTGPFISSILPDLIDLSSDEDCETVESCLQVRHYFHG